MCQGSRAAAHPPSSSAFTYLLTTTNFSLNPQILCSAGLEQGELRSRNRFDPRRWRVPQGSSWDVPQHPAPAMPPAPVEVWMDPTCTPRGVSPPPLQPPRQGRAMASLFSWKRPKQEPDGFFEGRVFQERVLEHQKELQVPSSALCLPSPCQTAASLKKQNRFFSRK